MWYIHKASVTKVLREKSGVDETAEHENVALLGCYKFCYGIKHFCVCDMQVC